MGYSLPAKHITPCIANYGPRRNGGLARDSIMSPISGRSSRVADLIPFGRVVRLMNIGRGLDPTRRLLAPLPDLLRADPRSRTAVGPEEAAAPRSTGRRTYCLYSQATVAPIRAKIPLPVFA